MLHIDRQCIRGTVSGRDGKDTTGYGTVEVKVESKKYGTSLSSRHHHLIELSCIPVELNNSTSSAGTGNSAVPVWREVVRFHHSDAGEAPMEHDRHRTHSRLRPVG